MYVVIVYDVGVERVNKVHKYLRTVLFWVQNSVFEGELSKSQLKKVKSDLNEIIESDIDSLIFFQFPEKFSKKEILGVEKNRIDFVI
ncbi:CRISPR-associated endonuclease Cas2 [Methanobrevibacter sp.]|uniref:CRISPR-associated endonuclease Cas2 n=1 Tax=Methanobrevibacter sp. TaxID=66852 RepID=UPI0026103C61|nr:CRISPR-associated endonuclease Cas2 [uncultured Methanobrevibacter sp.]